MMTEINVSFAPFGAIRDKGASNRIAALASAQNDDYGKGNVEAFKRGLGDKAATMVVKEASYELSDATIDTQIISLKSADDSVAAFGYNQAMMAVELLKRCGDNLTRENLMRQALSIKDLQLPLFLLGVRINTTRRSGCLEAIATGPF